MRGHRLKLQRIIVYLSLKIVVVLANSVDPDEMPHFKRISSVSSMFANKRFNLFLVIYLRVLEKKIFKTII